MNPQMLRKTFEVAVRCENPRATDAQIKEYMDREFPLLPPPLPPRFVCRGLRFAPRYLWIGIFWERTEDALLIDLCLLPTLPIRIEWRY